ncbi:MAG TPA: ABC transporter substrate-binding protein [Actinomycetota bacterium]|nr:ABC transporter substrate-binding protein [Actinomycetota bacterium]
MPSSDGSADRAPGERPADVHIRTFLIADVRGYTLFTQERGDEAAAKLAAKFAAIARETVESRGGTLLELRGDEALCVFSSAREAIRTALDLQQRFVQETLEQSELPLTVGIGLDAGEAVAVEGGYRGGALNLAARLCGQARAGEILASREVTHLARRLDGVRYQDRGSLTFKGISDPVVVVRVVPEGSDPVEQLRPYAPSPPAPAKASRRWAIVGGILTVALVGVSIPLLTSGDGAEVDIGTNSVARLSAEEGTVQLAAELGQRPGASAIGFGSLWVAHPDRGVVVRLDLDDGSRTDTIRVGTAPSGITVGGGSVWVSNAGDGTVSRINVEQNEVTQLLRVGSTPVGVAFGDDALWVADSVGAAIHRVDPATEDAETVPVAGLPSAVAFTPDGVWASVAPNMISRIDPKDPHVVFTRPVGNGPAAVLPAFGSIWVANSLDGTVTRVDPPTGDARAAIPVGQGPNALVAAGGLVWVATELDDAVVSIDPTTNSVIERVSVGGAAASLAMVDDDLWLAVGASATEHRGGTLNVSMESGAPPSLDPAVAYDQESWWILTMTNDGLLAYKKVGGPDGATIVPDLASALPTVSADGLIYRIPLRPGIRYSTGAPVRPEDFRRGIERALVLHDAGGLLSAIEGADGCTRDEPTACDLSDSIVVDEESVTFRLATPDPDLPFKLAMPFAFPVPADTPAEDQQHNALPATGPYEVSEAGPDGIELVRNPEFEEWSAAAQPNGFVNRISWRYTEGTAVAFDRLTAGDVDVMIQPPGTQDLAQLRSAHPDQIVAWPGPVTFYVGFDVLKPPFDDQRVRQALNHAIDREHVVDLLGGPAVQRSTCQLLPPNFQGYVPYCPYTLDPESNVWTGRDLDRARSLIEEAGVAGTRVTVSVAQVGLPDGAIETMEYVTELLEELGLEPTLETVPDAETYFQLIQPPTGDLPGTFAGTSRHPHVYFSGWIADYPGADSFIEPLFACGERGFANTSGWCSRSLDDRMDEALQLYTTNPGEASRTWTDIEHELVDDAALAPLSNPVTTHAVSDRVENVQVHPLWGLMLSLLWVQ